MPLTSRSSATGERTRRLVHPATGADLGPTLPLGYRVSAWMLDLHDNLLGGPTGRRVNGIGALALLGLCATGLIIWWPGAARWRRSVFVDRRANWKRLNWSLHSVLGLWFFALHPDVEPDRRLPLAAGSGVRLARLHRAVGRSQSGRTGRSIGFNTGWRTCTSAGWAAAGFRDAAAACAIRSRRRRGPSVGLVPVLMAVTGAVMWWNRVAGPAARRWPTLRARRRRLRPEAPAGSTATTIR